MMLGCHPRGESGASLSYAHRSMKTMKDAQSSSGFGCQIFYGQPRRVHGGDANINIFKGLNLVQWLAMQTDMSG